MSGPLRCADAVGVVEHADVLYVAALPHGPILVLEGVAPGIWHAAIGSERGAVADAVADAIGAEAAEIRADVDAFVDDLVERGLLREDGAG
ncbi:hypothetical protein ARHIZOSPH14_15950 [Agromyces rhizosphaerae]|uniref:PqqD family protein n=1 Tax=Agromyces rhizosphaerae TaxID=88374 RepID=A0A9W6D0R8_9MICO|nr:PqqD family peptide modification chaperone [Agromyces rhizosphaerae]GLI27353.1 hypothetical protein ARHIZOSPH14_15950 [Agromyces rhizosphaerae]